MLLGLSRISLIKDESKDVDVLYSKIAALKMRLSDSKMNEKNLEKLEQEVCILNSHITEKTTDQNIEIQIDDIGIGMKKNVMENIYKTFYTTKQSGKGNGLGLVIVKKSSKSLMVQLLVIDVSTGNSVHDFNT